MKAAIYCRVSTPTQKEAETIEGQRVALTKYAEDRGWEIVDVYEDEGLSGSFLEGRRDFLRLLEDMGKGEFEILLVAEHSRITRSDDPMEGALILKTLLDNDIKVASPGAGLESADTFEGRLMFTLKSMFAAKEKTDILERFKRGKAKFLEKGIYPNARVCYGLQKVVQRGKNGKVIKHEIVINEEEAAVLRSVYDWIVKDGQTINWAAAELNRLGIRTAQGKRWSSPRLSEILRNEALCGTMYCNRYVWKTTGISPKGKQQQKLLKVRPKTDPDVIHIYVPAIFSKDEFKLLRDTVKNNRRRARSKKDSPFLLTDKLKCGICGARLVGAYGGSPGQKKVNYYICHNRKKSPQRREPDEKPCWLPMVNMLSLDQKVERDVLIDLFMHPKRTLKSWSSVDQNKRRRAKQLRDKVAQAEERIEKLRKKKKALLQKAISGVAWEGWNEADIKEAVEGERVKLDQQITLETERRDTAKKEAEALEGMIERAKKVRNGSKELEEVAARLGEKILNMTVAEKRTLLDYIIPSGHYITVEPILDDREIWYDKPKGVARTLKCEWMVMPVTVPDFNLKGLVAALREYDKTGVIPKASVYLMQNKHLKRHSGNQ
ncbi:MAG: recombinase family protein [Thermodesulfobacteriota bacterium]|nr:recombinase family protein [Thermodesulfobacteriota bacterium]